MALSINSSSYAGEHAMPFVSAAVKSSRTIEAGGVKLMQGIKYRAVLQNISADTPGDIIDASACDYSDGFTLDTYERLITPIEMQTTLTLCKQNFHTDWLSKYQTKSANDNIPGNFESYMLSYVGSQIGSVLEDAIWTWNSSVSGQHFDGFLRLLDAASNTPAGQPNTLPAGQDNAFTNTDTGITLGEFRSTDADFVVAALQDVIGDIPNRVYSKGPSNLSLYCGFDPVRALITAYGSQAGGINDQSHMWWNGGFSGLRINGVDIFVAPGIQGTTNGNINRGTVIATYKDNLVVGVGAYADTAEATVLDMAKLDGSRNARVIYRYAVGTQIASLNDCVLYGGGTARA